MICCQKVKLFDALTLVSNPLGTDSKCTVENSGSDSDNGSNGSNSGNSVNGGEGKDHSNSSNRAEGCQQTQKCISINGVRERAGHRAEAKEKFKFSHPLWMLHRFGIGVCYCFRLYLGVGMSLLA